MPVSLHGPGKVELTTQATIARVDLATDIADPVRRLRAIRDALDEEGLRRHQGLFKPQALATASR